MLFMNKSAMLIGIGFALGVAMAMNKEDELHDLYYDIKKAKRKMIRSCSHWRDCL